MEWIVCTIIVLGVCLLLIFLGARSHYKKMDAITPTSKLVRVSGSTLYIDKRSSKLENSFSIKKHIVKNYQYNEEKIHVGAVSVGGVATGGVYKTGGDYSVKNLKTDRFELMYNYVNELEDKMYEVSVDKIVLSPELLTLAQNSNIAPYISGNKIIILEDVKLSDYAIMLTAKGDKDKAWSQAEIEKNEGFPTEEKAKQIKEWLCTDDIKNSAQENKVSIRATEKFVPQEITFILGTQQGGISTYQKVTIQDNSGKKLWEGAAGDKAKFLISTPQIKIMYHKAFSSNLWGNTLETIIDPSQYTYYDVLVKRRLSPKPEITIEGRK